MLWYTITHANARETYTALISLDQINLLGNAFISDYAKSHDGRKPFLDPSTQVRWDWGRSQPAGTLEEAMRNKTIFKDWFSNNVVGNDSNTCSDSVFIYPYTVGDTVYRNVYRFVGLTLANGAPHADTLERTSGSPTRVQQCGSGLF